MYNKGMVKTKRKPKLLQIMIEDPLRSDLENYLAEEYGPGERVISTVVRKALGEYLQRKKLSLSNQTEG